MSKSVQTTAELVEYFGDAGTAGEIAGHAFHRAFPMLGSRDWCDGMDRAGEVGTALAGAYAQLGNSEFEDHHLRDQRPAASIAAWSYAAGYKQAVERFAQILQIESEKLDDFLDHLDHHEVDQITLADLSKLQNTGSATG